MQISKENPLKIALLQVLPAMSIAASQKITPATMQLVNDVTWKRTKYDNEMMNENTGKIEEHMHLIKVKDGKTWKDCSNDLSQVVQGIRYVKGTIFLTFVTCEDTLKCKK